MELFVLLVNIIAILAVITGIAIGAWYLIGLYWVHSRKEEKELPEVDLPANIHEVFTGVPPALTIFYLFIFITSIIYVIYIWVKGISY